MNKLFLKFFLSLIKDKTKAKQVQCLLKKKSGGGGERPIGITSIDGLKYSQYLTTSVLSIHSKTFEEYKNKFRNTDVVVCGAGPSLNYYKPIESAIHIGTNRVHQKIKCDFLFRQDFKNYDQEILSCDIPKFIGNFYEWDLDMCPESLFNQLTNASKFIIDNSVTSIIPVDLISQPLWHGGSVIFSAFQFALWTNPRRIYLVGCDCAGQVDSKHWHHFDDSTDVKQNIVPITALVDSWKKMAQFSKQMYPHIQILSINPVGLKGIFTDIYQQ